MLTDLVLNPVFAPTDIERERGVILEEIKIDEDNPDVLVHELFTQSFWKGHPLGKPILGTTETVGRLEQEQLFAYHGDRFHGGNMVFSAAGNLDHDEFAAAVAEKFSGLAGGADARLSCRRPSPARASCCATRNRWSRCRSAWACPRRPSPTTTATPR